MKAKAVVSLIVRYLCLLFFTGFLGLLSGLFHLGSMGFRGAILGLNLSWGLILITFLSRRRLDAGHRPNWTVVGLTALLFSALTAFTIQLLGLNTDTANYELGGPYLLLQPPSQVFAVALLYFASLYAIYIYRQSSYVRAFFLVILAGFVCTLFRGFMSPSFGWLETMLISLLSGIPFCLAWFTTVALFDPAWTGKRWRVIRGLSDGR